MDDGRLGSSALIAGAGSLFIVKRAAGALEITLTQYASLRPVSSYLIKYLGLRFPRLDTFF